MHQNIILINCRIFLSDLGLIKQNQFLITNNDKIELFDDMRFFDETKYNPLHYNIIDCNNLLVIPGMIDLHVHFRDPGFKLKEDIETGSKSAAAGGFSMVVCQPNTNPVLDNPLVISYLKEKIKSYSKINIGFYASATLGLKGEQMTPIQTMISNGALGFTDDGMPISNSYIMKNLLKYSSEMGFIVAQHAEDHNLSSGGCIHSGRFAKTFNLRTIDPASEYSVIARDLAILENIKNAKYHILHVSCKESLRHIEIAKNKNLNVTSEITPHHFILNDDALFENFAYAKMNPPLRSDEDILGMIDGMKSGIIDIIASDHAPHEDLSKESPISCASFGIVGLETMLGLSLELFHKGYISLERILQMLTINPAKLISRDDIGIIKKGSRADLAIIDENEIWIVDKYKLNSKSKNTPFHGKKLKGRNIATICNGEIVFNLL